MAAGDYRIEFTGYGFDHSSDAKIFPRKFPSQKSNVRDAPERDSRSATAAADLR
jgi:hypothetical protein